MKKLLIDIGGTHLRSRLHGAGNTLSEIVSSQHQGLMGYIDQKMGEHPDIDFIGISYAGQVSDGVILSAPNIEVDEHSIKEAVASRYGIRLEIDNDLNCAVLAEADYWGSTSVAALYVGTGIGAAVIDQGRLVRGSRNLSFELGHIPYRTAPFLCGCGRNNCIELFASGSGMDKWVDYYGSGHTGDLEGLKSSSVEDERRIAEAFETALLHAAGTLVTLANPELLVLGGGIITQNPYVVERLHKHLGEFTLRASLETVRIEMSRLDNGPLEGARLLEKRNYE